MAERNVNEENPLVPDVPYTAADLDLQIKGGGGGDGHPDPEIRGWGSQFFWGTLRASVWFKNKGGAGAGGGLRQLRAIFHGVKKYKSKPLVCTRDMMNNEVRLEFTIMKKSEKTARNNE